MTELGSKTAQKTLKGLFEVLNESYDSQAGKQTLDFGDSRYGKARLFA